MSVGCGDEWSTRTEISGLKHLPGCWRALKPLPLPSRANCKPFFYPHLTKRGDCWKSWLSVTLPQPWAPGESRRIQPSHQKLAVSSCFRKCVMSPNSPWTWHLIGHLIKPISSVLWSSTSLPSSPGIILLFEKQLIIRNQRCLIYKIISQIRVCQM